MQTLATIQRGHLTLQDWERMGQKTRPGLPQTRKPYRPLATTPFGRILDAGVVVLMVSSALAALECFLHL